MKKKGIGLLSASEKTIDDITDNIKKEREREIKIERERGREREAEIERKRLIETEIETKETDTERNTHTGQSLLNTAVSKSQRAFLLFRLYSNKIKPALKLEILK